jgi:hypothetical protein
MIPAVMMLPEGESETPPPPAAGWKGQFDIPGQRPCLEDMVSKQAASRPANLRIPL